MEMTSISYHIPKPFLNSSCYTSVGVSTICISRFPVVFGNRSPRNRKISKVVKVVAAASTGRGRGAAAVNGSSRNEQELQLSSKLSTSALDQLDIERGVCIPFRKYSPETVSIHVD